MATRMLWGTGTTSLTSSWTEGDGFKIRKKTTGTYEIEYSFTSPPSVVVSPLGSDLSASAIVQNITNKLCTVLTVSVTGNRSITTHGKHSHSGHVKCEKKNLSFTFQILGR